MGGALLSSWSRVSLTDVGWTTRLSDSLGGLTGLRKALMHAITVYCSERIPIKISRRERYVGQSLEETRHTLPGVPSQ